MPPCLLHNVLPALLPVYYQLKVHGPLVGAACVESEDSELGMTFVMMVYFYIAVLDLEIVSSKGFVELVEWGSRELYDP